MPSVHYDANLCLMTKFSSLISGKWKPIILHLIEGKINRFSLMQNHMPTINKKVLTEQLRELEADGLVYREELKAKAPKVVVYHLTNKGESLRKLIDEIIAWSLEHMNEDIPHESVSLFVHTYPDLSNNLPWLDASLASGNVHDMLKK